jgi:hypothetical protein
MVLPVHTQVYTRLFWCQWQDEKHQSVVKIQFGWIFRYFISGFKLLTSHIDKY